MNLNGEKTRNTSADDKVRIAERLLNRRVPMVSVIVPNYNHSKYLKERIGSILSQTYDDFELILLDDCSTDDSRDILLSYKDNPHVSRIIINDKNSGSPFSQWKKGMDAAVGKYVWIAESDDSAEPSFLEKTIAQLEVHPEAQICLTGSKIIDGDGNLRHDYDNEFDLWAEDRQAYVFSSDFYLRSHMLSVNSVYNASMVLFRKTGDSDLRYTKMRYCGDWLFWIEQIRKGAAVIEIHEKLNHFRKHGTNVTSLGTEEWVSFREICIVKRILCEEVLKDKELIWKDRANLYEIIKSSNFVSNEKRRKELYRIARKEYGVNYIELLWRKVLDALWSSK